MAKSEHKQAQVDAFLVKETESYKQRLLWLEEAMPKSFFSEAGVDSALLVAHSLVGFELQEYYATINLRQAALILCLDVPGADIRTFMSFESRNIASMRVFVSEKPYGDTKQNLRISLLYFEGIDEEQHATQQRFWEALPEPKKLIMKELIAKAERDDLVHS